MNVHFKISNKIISKNSPCMIIAEIGINHMGDINNDHQIVSYAVLTALRPINKNNVKSNIRTFEKSSSSDQSSYIEPYLFKPNFYVSIENEWKKNSSFKNI